VALMLRQGRLMLCDDVVKKGPHRGWLGLASKHAGGHRAWTRSRRILE
jgi:hypothetical protein